MSVALPGQVLVSDKDHVQGPGTHWHQGNICASVAGLVTKQDGVVSVSRGSQLAPSIGTKNVLPTVHATVLARVTRINPRQANVAILVIGEGQDACVCPDELQGLIRVQDIRATEKDKVKVGDSFRPGDIVRALVVGTLLYLLPVDPLLPISRALASWTFPRSSRGPLSACGPFRPCLTVTESRYLWVTNQITILRRPAITWV